MYINKTAVLFVVIAFVSGLCGAFFYPLSGLFIVEELGASPKMLSVYMVIAVVSSVFMSQWIARQSDRGWRRKTILIVSLSSYLVTVASFSVIRDYWLAVAIAALFGSVSGAAFGQLFALGREYADTQMKSSTTFLSTMRAGISIAWVFGPPGAFMLKANFGFSAAFIVSALIVSIAIILIACYLPSGGIQAAASQVESKQAQVDVNGTNPLVLLYCIVLVATFVGGNLYVTSMPLYLSQELQVNPNWLGILFGAAALCEIPVMLGAGKVAERIGAVKLMMAALVSGCVFYYVMLTHSDFSTMLAAQVLNGVYIGITATIGMVVLQDMMRHKLGTASTLFSNMINISMLIASLSVGVVGEWYSYFHSLYVCLTTTAIAFVLLAIFSQFYKRAVTVQATAKLV